MPQRSAIRRRQKQDFNDGAEEETEARLQSNSARDFEAVKTNLALLSFGDDIDRSKYSPRQTKKKNKV
jgi:hypothetical protein